MKSPLRPLSLGQFELIALIAKGGMGEVWRGQHVSSSLPVAIKIITGDQDAAQFRSEVRSAARLGHPNIVTVFDQGHVPSAAAASSGGQLEEGLPFLAMELVSGGTLADRRYRRFAELSHVLTDILAALGHAHARGVIHRDLKPANVLLPGQDDERPGLKLSDFGIARAMRGEEIAGSKRVVIGTLRYMAPEQILGRFRDEGPWTDLYALGAMTYQLASGRPMFGDTGGGELAHHHINVPPPPLRSRTPMPDGFQGWLDKLLAKVPSERFELAADAADALAALGPPKVERISTSPGGNQNHDARSLTVVIPGPAETQIPDHWEPAAALPPPPRRLVGAGLGLWGLRPIPMVGRLEERDALWTALGKVVATELARAVVLVGRAGTGKSRLCEWLCERAHEAGAARSIRTAHSPIAAPSDGLAQMVRASLSTEGLSRELSRERALKFVAAHPLVGDRVEYEASALAELACNDDEGETDRVRFTNPDERYRVVSRLLERRTAARPLIVWLDDVHWGGDALRFVASAIRTKLPVLFVATARKGVLASRPDEREQIARLRDVRGFRELDISAFEGGARVELAECLLGLSGELTSQVAERTGGNPLFAVQLVGDWVTRGVLRAGAAGFELEPGAETPIPDTIQELWMTRARALARQTTDDGDDERLGETLTRLEIAAALGQSVAASEWRAACASSDSLSSPASGLSNRIVEQLLDEGFAHATADGWEFSHSMFRESLERRAKEGGRWQGHHRACARALTQLYSENSAHVAARQGRHLHAAGDLDEALPYLLAGAEAYRLVGDHALSHALHDERDAALKALGAAPEDRRWIEGVIKRAATFQQEGRVEEAIECLSGGTWAAIEQKYEGLVARAETIRGRIHFDMGNPTRARESYERAKLLFEKLGDCAGLVACLNGLGSVCMWLRDLEAASTFLEEARSRSQKSGDLFELGQTLRALAHVRHCERDYSLATELYQRARGCFEHVGCRIEVGNCVNDLGELARTTGDLESAERHYRNAAGVFASLGAPALTTATYNLGLVLLHRGEVELARTLFLRQLANLEGKVRSVDRLWLEAALLACAARMQDWQAWETRIQEVESLVIATGFVDEDIAELAVTSGNVTAACGELDRAKRIYALARSQLVKMEHADRVEQIDVALSAIDRVASQKEN